MPTKKEIANKVYYDDLLASAEFGSLVASSTMPSKTTLQPSGLSLEALQNAAKLLTEKQAGYQTVVSKQLSGWLDDVVLTPSPFLAPVPGHLGLTSQLASSKHIIMWDFDNKTFAKVTKLVESYAQHPAAQPNPPFYIVQSNADALHFHVYCFKETELTSSGNADADFKHYKHSQALGFSTLRVTPKDGFAPKVVGIVSHGVNNTPEVPLSQLTTFVVYSGVYGDTTPSQRYTINTYDLMQAVKFLQQLETAQKTKEIPNA